jgi:hypothetical protein
MKRLTVVALMMCVVPAYAVSYDVAVQKLEATNAPGGKFVGQTLNMKVTVVNIGPGAISSNDGVKVVVSRYDQTGQQFQKEVYKRDVFLLQPYNNTTDTAMIVTFTDNPAIGSYFYKAGIVGNAYYTDPNNANNKAEMFIQVSGPLTWTGRLWPQDFTRAGATVSSTMASKLNGSTYSLQSIVSGSTDRVVDTMKCNSCHSGTDSQSAGKYQPVYDGTNIAMDRDHKVTKGGAVTSGFRWNASGSNGVIGHFVASTYNKPAELEKIFQLWLSDGARP